MEILSFLRPSKVAVIEAYDCFGRYKIGPLEPSFGVTIGNSMRRILLSSLEGFAIASVKVDGVLHEFGTIPGVIEDMSNLILNLKQVRLKQTVMDKDSETVIVHVSGSELLTAEDIGKQLSSFTVLNGDLVLCHMDPSADFVMELKIVKGRGFRTADENYDPTSEVNVIPMDTIFSPITLVRYEVVNHDQSEDLLLDVHTDGSIHPTDALAKAAHILIQHFSLLTEEAIVESELVQEKPDFDEETLRMRQLLQTPIFSLKLSVRAMNCLRAAGVETVGELVQHQKYQLLRYRNFGKKSMTEIEDLLETIGLTFGMDLTKYQLEDREFSSLD